MGRMAVLCNVPGMRTQRRGEGRQEKLGVSQPLPSHFPSENGSRGPCEIRKHVVMQRGTRTILAPLGGREQRRERAKEGESLFWSRNCLFFPLVLPYFLRWVIISSQATPGVSLASRVPTALEDSKRQLELFTDLFKGAGWSIFPSTFLSRASH